MEFIRNDKVINQEIDSICIRTEIFDCANVPREFYEIKKCHICGPDFYAGSISLKISNWIVGVTEVSFPVASIVTIK